MTIYLAIITTVLVVTQIIRVTQNAIQLKSWSKEHIENELFVKRWKSVVRKLDFWLDYTLEEIEEQQMKELEKARVRNPLDEAPIDPWFLNENNNKAMTNKEGE